jgi:Tfp pilus assembly protein FimV
MWIPTKFLDLLKFNLDEQVAVRTKLAVAESRVTDLERSLAHSRTSFDWLTSRVNDLEYQNKALLEKAYNISVPAPQISRPSIPPIDLRECPLFSIPRGL